MKKYFLILFAALPLILSGCVESARYSPEEIKAFPQPMQEKIKHGEIAAGMTHQQVRYAWGAPNTINILTPSEEGKYREEWIYTKIGGFFKTQLIFVDGKLMHIVTNEPGVIKK